MLHFKSLRVAAVSAETDESVSVAFDVPEALAETFRWLPGQHVTLRKTLDGREVRRSYSICQPPGSGKLCIAIKKAPRGVFSTWANETLRAGDMLDVLEPTGSFHTPLDPVQRKTYVAFVGGSGITPIMSILESTLETEQESRFVLFYANRTRASIMFRDRLEDLKNRYMSRLSLHFLLTGEQLDNAIYNGRIDADKVRMFAGALCPVERVDEFFICGPSTMIEDVSAALRKIGAAPDHIHVERFTSAPAQTRQTKASAQPDRQDDNRTSVTVILDGASRQFDMPRDGSKVLDAALDAGIELPYSCMGGVCCTCRSKLREGRVEMEVNYALEEWEVEEGFVLTCQSRPLTETLLLDFDQT